jgi:hypothetical protein
MSCQQERVRRYMQRAGEHGTTQTEWLPPDVVDGGPPITRLAARVLELRESGHRIEKNGHRDGCDVYVWRSPVPVGSTGESALVGLREATRVSRSAIFDFDDAA